MTQDQWFNLGVAFAGVLMGIGAAKLRLNSRPNGRQHKPLLFYEFENEIMGVLKTLRVDTEKNFDVMKEQHMDIIRRLRKHDDDLFDIKNRIDSLEGK